MTDSVADQALALLEGVITGPTRAGILDSALAGGDFARARAKLREALSRHELVADGASFSLGRVLRGLDRRTRDEGFHVLQAWDFREHRFSDDHVGVLMMDFAARDQGVPEARETLAILLDYYLLHALALVVMRAWDGEQPGETFERVTRALELLGGPHGSGRRFVGDAETLLVLAVSHFHPEERAYDGLIERVRALDAPHQVRFALASAPVLSSHLRWGFEVMYGHDVLRMREDNAGDYPWLVFSVATLMGEYVRLRREGAPEVERARVVEALLAGIAADPWAFAGRPPSSVSVDSSEYSTFLRLFGRYKDDLLDEFAAHRPTPEAYSPLGLFFNFPHNALVALTSVALRGSRDASLPLDALLWARDAVEASPDAREALARSLMAFSGSSVERADDRGALLIVYDPHAGLASYSMAVSTVRKHVT